VSSLPQAAEWEYAVAQAEKRAAEFEQELLLMERRMLALVWKKDPFCLYIIDSSGVFKSWPRLFTVIFII
jgi:hypothetical protein